MPAYNPKTKYDYESIDEVVIVDDPYPAKRPSWSDAPPSLLEDVAALLEEEARRKHEREPML
jgi:hypothetical protein